MTQAEFAKWLETVLGNAPMDELVAPEILQHMDRVHLEGEQRAYMFAKEDSLESFQLTVRAMVKTMFIIGYDAGREQAKIDNLFGGGSGLEEEDDSNDRQGPAGALPL